MKTAKQILSKYVFTEEWRNQEVVTKKDALRAMKIYAEEVVKNCNTPAVSREVCDCIDEYLQCDEFGNCPSCGKLWR